MSLHEEAISPLIDAEARLGLGRHFPSRRTSPKVIFLEINLEDTQVQFYSKVSRVIFNTEIQKSKLPYTTCCGEKVTKPRIKRI